MSVSITRHMVSDDASVVLRGKIFNVFRVVDDSVIHQILHMEIPEFIYIFDRYFLNRNHLSPPVCL